MHAAGGSLRSAASRLTCAWVLKCALLQAERSISKYGVHAVVANILDTRKEVVHVVRPAEARNGGSIETDRIDRGQEHFIEKPLVEDVTRLHQLYLSTAVL